LEPLYRIWKEDFMKGHDQMLSTLNNLLADELTAVNQYMVHAGMCANWGYEKLHVAIEKRAIDEMKHAEKLLDRILFLQGTPIVSNLHPMQIGPRVETQLENDCTSETGAVKIYNEAIRQAAELGDNGTRSLLQAILSDEEKHLDWLEAQLDQIEQLGVQNYLQAQVG
jgi:bacterioferritin